MSHVNRRTALIRQSMLKALRLRAKYHISPNEAVSIFDLTETCGAELRFLDLPSFEGMYAAMEPPVIMVSSLRPSGRQAFTCAHELGHMVMQHGTSIDELVDNQSLGKTYDDKELMADSFAQALLMPESAIQHALAARKWEASSLTREQIFKLASWLGVGYEGLVKHLACTLRLIDRSHEKRLLEHSPQAIRAALLGRECPTDLLCVDEYWIGRPIDAKVGDHIQLPEHFEIEGDCLQVEARSHIKRIATCARPGRGRIINNTLQWAAYFRVSRKDFKGRNRFRFDEEVENE